MLPKILGGGGGELLGGISQVPIWNPGQCELGLIKLYLYDNTGIHDHHRPAGELLPPPHSTAMSLCFLQGKSKEKV